jgi:hypothetical protein
MRRAPQLGRPPALQAPNSDGSNRCPRRSSSTARSTGSEVEAGPLDERVALAYRPSSSLSRKTAAFRRIARSIRSFAFSSRNRPSSSRSSPLRPPGRSPRDAFCSLSQFRSVTSEIRESTSLSAAYDRKRPSVVENGSSPICHLVARCRGNLVGHIVRHPVGLGRNAGDDRLNDVFAAVLEHPECADVARFVTSGSTILTGGSD